MKLRLPEEMRDRIAELAKQNNRSMNAEILNRLEWALSLVAPPKIVDSSHVQQPVGGALTWLITSEIKDLADREAVSFDEMFARIVLAGLHQNAPQVVYLPVFPGVTKEEQVSATRAATEVVRPDATVIVDNLWRAPWAPEWMIKAMKTKLPEVIAQVADQKIMAIDAQFNSDASEDQKPKPKPRIRRPVKPA